MNKFDDREKSFEKKFVIDEELKFKIEAKRNKLLGQWVSEIMGYDESQTKAYVEEVIKADFKQAGDDDVFHKVKEDLDGNNISDEELRKKMAELYAEAKNAIQQVK